MKLAAERHRTKLSRNETRRPSSSSAWLEATTVTRVFVCSCLLSLCLQGCGASTPERRDSANSAARETTLTQTDNAPTPPAGTQRKDAVTEEFLINARQMGRARLGMPFGDLKTLYPNATFHIVSVRPDKTSDIALRQEGRDILFVRTREMDETTVDELPQSDDPVRSVMTNDARYATAESIRAGSSLADAVKAYGTPELYYQPPTEFAAFPAPAVKNLTFHLAGASEKEPAGVYRLTPEGMEDGWYKSNRAQGAGRITFIAVLEM